ncbi:hypothetical protein [Cellulophaga geojensis]|nr:hypothetical protein [Cellulophaga geojensis]
MDSKIDFFADSNTGQKIKNIKKELKNSSLSNRYEFIKLINNLDELREKRNIIVHSLVLSNSNDHLFHNYLRLKGEIVNKTTQFSTSDLEGINIEVCNVHNALFKLHYNNSN